MTWYLIKHKIRFLAWYLLKYRDSLTLPYKASTKLRAGLAKNRIKHLDVKMAS